MNFKLLKSARNGVESRPIIGVIILSAFYFFGVLGILSDYHDWFIEKTAFNLTLSFIILLLYQKSYNLALVWAFSFSYLLGFAAEYIGVNHGLVFGDYIYPNVLGPQIAGVPLIIGVNWFLITFCVASLIFPMKIRTIWKILLATVVAVLIDVLIEPVAMELNFWNWDNNEVPFQNYVGWAVISFLIFCFYALVKVSVENRIAIVLLLWQVAFFVALNLFLVN